VLPLSAATGFSGGFASTAPSLSTVALAGDGRGMQRDSAGAARVFAADLRDGAEIGRRAGERAVAMLDARNPPTGAYPVRYDERASGTLIGRLLVAINGR